MPWGIDVPGDPEHVMFVWFDALINYISTLEWPNNKQRFEDFWPGLQVAGKDNLRQQTAIWQAMLMSAGLPNSKQIFIHGFITVNGQKISKSLGNVINPIELTKKYDTEAVRYFILAKLHPYEDSDFTYERFEEAYNSDLANGLGNLVSRVAKLCEQNNVQCSAYDVQYHKNKLLDEFKFNEALAEIWKEISEVDQQIEKDQPWKNPDPKNLSGYVERVRDIAKNLLPFLPQTAQKILDQFTGPTIKSELPLFPRIK